MDDNGALQAELSAVVAALGPNAVPWAAELAGELADTMQCRYPREPAPVADIVTAIREAVGGRTADVIIDYTGGQPAEAALRASGPTTRLVQVGERAGQANISAQTVRTTGASVQGFMPPHARPIAMKPAYHRLVGWAADGSLRVDVQRLPLDQVAHAWELANTSRHRVVLIP